MLQQKPEDSSLQLRTLENSSSMFQRGQVRKTTLKGCQKGDYALAVEHISARTNRYQNGEEVPWNVDVEHFKQYGTGVYLFFHFTKRLALLFAIFAIIAIVPVAINAVNGDAFSNMIKTLGVYFARTTVGNLNSNPQGPSAIDSATSRRYKLENAVPDILMCFAFLGFYLYWEVKSDRLTEQIKGEIRLQCHYSLELDEFPLGTTQEQVHKFFAQFGKVKEVSAVQNYSQLLEQAKDIYDLSQKKKEILLALEEQGEDVDPEDAKKRQQQIKKYQLHIVEMQNYFAFNFNGGSACVLKYFVVFEEPESRQLALKTLQGYKKCCQCRKGTIPEEHTIGGQLVGVSPCHNEPGDIIWENLHVQWHSKLLRGILQAFLLILVLAVTFLVISLLNIATPSTSTYLDVSHYDHNSIMNVTNSTIVYVWCIDYKDEMNTYRNIYELCTPYINRYYTSLVIGVIISCIVVGVKFVLKKIVVALAKFQRYRGHTEQSIGIMRNLFYTYVCTTCLITVLLQANIFGLSFKQLILTLTSNGYLQDNGSLLLSFSDFVPFWYVDIGYKLNMTMIIMALQAPIMTPILLFIKEKFRQWRGKKQLTQRRMEEVMMPDSFEIEDHYANTLLLVFMAFAFYSGMPLILVPCGIALVLRYFYYKLVFLRFNLTPPALDEALNQNVVRVLPYILFLHFAFGVWMLSTNSIFPHEESFVSDMMKSNNSFSRNLGFLLMRLGDTWYFTITFLICMAVIILKVIFYDFIYEAYKARAEESQATAIVPKKIQIGPATEGEMTKSEKELLVKSYKIESNPMYSEILGIMNRLKDKQR